MSRDEAFSTIVIGGGQAGLAAGYYLTQLNENFIILDENPRTGETWRRRWDSLRLFTPSQNNGLPGMKFPKPDFYFPTKDEAADFLATYATQFSLPVRYGVKVGGLQRNETGYHISAGESGYHARKVIVATGAFHTPHIPGYARELNHGVFQLHSAEYRNPKVIPAKNVVVVGAGNSGAEIAVELAQAGRKVWLAGREVGQPPAVRFRKLLGGRPYWWFLRNVLTVNTPMGRRLKANIVSHGSPLVRIQREQVAGAGVELTPRLAGASDGKPQLEDGRTLPAEGIVWATGFHPDYHWINLPVFDDSGRPRHTRGVVPEAPGLYFLGLLFQTGLTSSLLGGVGNDAKYITRHIKGN
jgi:putative flavoprotein involved in K+ transport